MIESPWRCLMIAIVLGVGGWARAQDVDDEPLRLRGLLPSGVRASATESWGAFRFTVSNANTANRSVRILVYYPGRPDLQYGRDVWLPGNSSLAAWLPVGPAESQLYSNGRKIEYLLYDLSGGAERLVLPQADERVRTRDVIYRRREPTTAIMVDDQVDENVFFSPPEPVVFARTIRNAGGMSEQVFVVQPGFMPALPGAFDGIDHFILASNRLLADPAGQEALRHWVQQGGKLWIMLDQIKPETAAAILGEDLDFQVVDRISLTSIKINRTKLDALAAAQRELEQPVDFVRVALSGGDRVLQTVNGWPAAFVRQVGRGKVVFSTLGPRGWHRPRTREDSASPYSSFPNLPVYLVPLGEVAAELRLRLAPHPFTTENLQPLLTEEIGYSIMSQRMAGAIFGVLVLALVGLGVGLRRSRRPELLGWLSPAAAIAAAALFVVLGEGSRRAVPPTVAVAEVVDAVPGSGEAAVNGLYAIYRPASGLASIDETKGAVLDLDAEGLEGQNRRRIQTDLDAWHWDNLALPAGARSGPFRYTIRPGPLAAKARFGPNGLEGRLSLNQFRNLADALIVTSAHEPIAVRLGEGGNFTAGSADMLPSGQFLSGVVLTDQQQRRQAVYRQLLTPTMPEHLEGRDLLLAWSEPAEIPFASPEGGRTVGTALLIVPLVFERPAAGTNVTIPSAFVPFRRDSNGQLVQPVLASQIAVDMRLRFQIPPSLLPLKVERATLVARVRAPGWRLTVGGFADDKLVPLHAGDSPVEPVRLEIVDERLLKADERGGLHFNVALSDARGPGGDRPRDAQWKIESLTLEVVGKTTK
jgi:hypothetical protein